MSSADNIFYQSAKGGLAMRLSNAEQMAQGREGLLTSLDAQNLTLDDDLEHAKTNRDTAIFGISLSGGGAYKLAYGIGKSVGSKYLNRATNRLQNAVDQYRKMIKPTEDQPPTTETQPPTTETQPPTAEAGIEPETGLPETADASTMIDINDPIPRNLLRSEYQQRVAETQDYERAGVQPPESIEDIQADYERGLDPTTEGRPTQFQREQAREIQTQTEPEPEPEPEPQAEETQVRPPVEPSTEDMPLRPAGDLTEIPQQTLDDAGNAIRTAARPPTMNLPQEHQYRLAQIQESDPILSEQNVGDLKKMGLDLGDLSPQEVDTSARFLLGDSAVEGLSSMLDVAGGVLGTALPVIGAIGDIAGLAYAVKGLFDSSEAVEKEQTAKTQLQQAIAQTNIPTQVAKQGSAPVLDTSANRVGGFQNF
jgi:hypothetical protein